MKQKLLISLLLLFISISLSSCGNKGDLYMPDKNDDSSEKVTND